MRRFINKPLAQWVIVIGIFVFLGKMVWGNWPQVKEAHFFFRPFPLLLSTFIFVLSYFIQIWAWYLITLKLGIAISISETLGSWFYSQLGKYLPGKVWLLLARFYFYESKGKSKKAISIALYFEMVTLIVAGGLICLIALLFFKKGVPLYSGNQFWYLVLLLILFLFVFLHPQVLQKILNWALVLFKREPLFLSISYSDVLWILSLCILSWVIGGISFYLFIDSVYPVSSETAIFLTGALAFSTILGIVAIFAPSGLGVREGALVYLLSFLMPPPVAVIISILTRIWMTLIEIGLIGMVYLISRFRKMKERRSRNV